ncbi:hypothetical protein [Ohtaekwangia koreensis]|uniref:hypothetical protein n=1 Tax=Ohtaekwangia koreensis TaxID=688867 RepID=UPI00117FE11D|nr:hypothetical protein [Ohtaekwangia koreensis]
MSNSTDYNDSYDVDIAIYKEFPDVQILQLFGFETASKHIKASGISPVAGIIVVSATVTAIGVFINSELEDHDTL